MPEIEFAIILDGQEMRVSYRSDWSRSANYAHFQFRSPHEPPQRIPVSRTGYRSHFSPRDEVESFPSVEEYAHALALAIMRENAAPADEDEENEQGSLF
jgi:hypothetical protein